VIFVIQGDNNVLLQQGSNWLIKLWLDSKSKDFSDEGPLGSLSFLKGKMKSFNAKSVNELLKPEVLLENYKWLVTWLLKSSAEKFQGLQKEGRDTFTSKNDSQVYKARTLSIAYIEHYVMELFWKRLQNPEIAPEIRSVLIKLLLLFGYWSLEKHLTSLYQGGFAQGPTAAALIRETVLHLCEEIKPDAVALVDAIAPPDFILNSCLGHSDGQVYKNLQLAMSQTPNGFERDSYWQDIVGKIQSKL